MKKKILITSSILAVFLVVILIFRTAILMQIGNFLISEDQLKKSDAIFVLGGGPFDRGNKAAELYKEGWSSKIITTGEFAFSAFKAMGIDKLEAEVTKFGIVELNSVPESAVEAVNIGTSTKEEADFVLKYSKKNGFKRIIVVSDKFHTNRIRSIFDKIFENSGVEVLLSGAPSSLYKEDKWWQYEHGLIMVNNEYVKSIYYLIKY